METKKSRRVGPVAWSAVAAALIILSALSLSVPAALAQPAEQPADTKRYFDIFQNVFNFIMENYVDTVDPQVLFEGAMTGMFDSLGDPYSTFLTEAMMSDMNDTTTGKFGGLGLYISKQAADPKAGPGQELFVEIVSPIEDTPGWRAGIQPGDLIVDIEGESTAPLAIDEVLKRLRGTPGTKVTIGIKRGDTKPFPVTITRAMIEIPTVKKALIQRVGGKVAYLRIVEFTPQTAPRVREALQGFAKEGYTSLVIDLRNNPGGLLQSVVQVADLFLASGGIVSTKARDPDECDSYSAKPDRLVPAEIPIVVLINRGSASASEILAGALKDNRRALLVGEKSYGKGSVQQIFPIGETGFKLTMARYYTPSDANIDKQGIEPDLSIVEAELSEAETTSLRSLLDGAYIAAFLKAKPEPQDADIKAFIADLSAKGIKLSERIVRKLVRDEYFRTRTAPVYDLEYDIQLVAAIEALESADFQAKLAQVPTVRELQERAQAAAK